MKRKIKYTLLSMAFVLSSGIWYLYADQPSQPATDVEAPGTPAFAKHHGWRNHILTTVTQLKSQISSSTTLTSAQKQQYIAQLDAISAEEKSVAEKNKGYVLTKAQYDDLIKQIKTVEKAAGIKPEKKKTK